VQVGGRDARLVAEVDHLFRYASGFSVALIVTGSRTPVADLRAASVRFPSDVRVLMMRIDTTSPTGFQPLGSNTLITLNHLDDLAQVLWAAMS
jgi:hypothetical protein